MIKRYWLQIIFFSAITGYFLFGLSPDMTWMSIGADQMSYVVAAGHNAPAGLSGNPLYILLGSLIVRLPGNPFWLLGLLSAIPMAATCVVIYLIVRKFTTNQFAPYISSLAFASAFVVWSEAVIAETYGLSLLAMSLVLFFCFSKKYYWMAGIMALTVGLHPLCVLVDIPCLVYVWWIEGHDFKLASRVIGITLVGLVFRLRDFFTSSPTLNAFYQQNSFENILYSAGGYLGLPVIPFGPTLQRIGEDLVVLGSSTWTLLFCVGAHFTKRKEVYLLSAISILALFFPFSSIYPQWIKYFCIPCLPMAILVGIGIDKMNLKGFAAVLFIPCLVFAGLNVAAYSPGKTVDTNPTQARVFYMELSTLPDNAIVVGHTWGHPDLVVYYYCVQTHDRIDYVNYDSLHTEFANSLGKLVPSTPYYQSLLKRGIDIDSMNADVTVEQTAQILQALNPEREVYVTYVKSSEIPMEFGLVPASEYYPGLNDLPSSKIDFSR